MSEIQENYRDNLAAQRKTILEEMGGLTEVIIHNNEWLYMLEEETRNSVSIEGYVATEQELKAIVQGGKTAPEILNYYRTAQSSYSLAWQYHRAGEVRLDMPLVWHIHSELFRGLSEARGTFRRGGIRIQGASVHPPEFDIDEYVRAWLRLSLDILTSRPILPALARIHVLFEGIHPFSDGNGRVGRILLNYLTVSQGYTPIIIKGITEAERKRYYEAFGEADKGFHQGFPDPEPKALQKHLEQGDFGLLEELLFDGLCLSLDPIIATALERLDALLEFKELAPRLGVQESTLRQWVHRGKLIAIRRGKKLYSHPRLSLL
ncbi:MAG TPA: Fic family protein [Ktedonobacterales bacterium]